MPCAATIRLADHRCDFHYTVADYDSLSQKGIADLLYDRGMQILQAKDAVRRTGHA